MRLSVSLSPLLCAFAAFVFALPVEAEPELKGLTGETFDSSVSHGLWFVEYFSPYCGHCTHFKPTWKKLTERYQPAEATSNFFMAQVNCITQGDLCTKKDIKYYPQMRLYVDGEEKETFEGNRDEEALIKYLDGKIQDYVKTIAPPPEPQQEILSRQSNANPEGKLLTLQQNTFKTAVEEGPLFVKFFAPWCGHCKKLAPTWVELASTLKGVMNVAEVNCDENSSLCRQEGIEGYPMLYIYNNGRKVEYRGSRKLEALEKYAKKAVNPGLKAVDAASLTDIIQSEKVVYLYLHTSATPSSDVKKVEDAGKALLGDPPIVKSVDPLLWDQYHEDPSRGPVLIAIKHGEAATSKNIDPTTDVTSVARWLTENKFPLFDELSGDNFSSVMGSESGAMVVLVAIDTEKYTGAALKEQTSKLNEMAKLWNTMGRKVLERPVVFVWMDGPRWQKWLKSMYGIKQAAMPAVIVADHENLVYYDIDSTQKPIPFEGDAVIQVLEAIDAGQLKSRYSQNIIERAMLSIHTKFTHFETYFTEHPLRSMGFLAAVVSLIVIGLWKLIQLDVEPAKHTRLD